MGYVRMSTSKQDLSCSVQGAALERWAAAEDVELVAVFFDMGASGSLDVSERPGLAAALGAVQDAALGVLVAAKRDRFARDAYVAGSIERLAAKAGARVCAADGANGDGDGDAFKRDIDSVLAAHERRVIRRRTRDALAIKKGRGEITGSAPYGQRRGADGVHLEPAPAEMAVITRAKALSDEGLTVRAITLKLNDEGHRNRAGKPFAFQSVYTLLRPLLGVLAVVEAVS